MARWATRSEAREPYVVAALLTVLAVAAISLPSSWARRVGLVCGGAAMLAWTVTAFLLWST